MTGDMGAGIAAALVKEIWICVQNVKIYRRRCRNLAWRCDFLINSLTENATDIVLSPTDALHEAEELLLSVRSRVMKWADLNIMQSILAQRAINEGVNTLHQKIDTCVAAYNIRIGQELAHGQRVLAIAAGRDRIELRDTLRDLQEQLSRNTYETRAHVPYSPLSNTATDDVLHFMDNHANDIQPSTFDDDKFDYAVKRFCTSLETLDLRLTMDTSRNPPSSGPLSSQVSIVARDHTRTPMRSMSTFSLRLPGLSTVRRPSSVLLGSCPQIPPLDFDDETIEYFPSHPASLGPTSTSPTRSPAYSEPSFVRSRHSNILAGPQPRAHTTESSISSSISTGSTALSQVEIALRTRTSMLCSRGNPRVLIKGTMEGLVRYLLLNPADKEHHETFFIGHPLLISSQDVLRILIRQFDESMMYADDTRDVNVMRLIKSWLTTQNIIIANDVLAEIQIFANSIDSSNTLRERALDVLQCIADKAAQNFPFTSITSSFDPTDSKPTERQLAAGLATFEREKYLHILAAEYIAHACQLTSGSPNLQEALDFNKKIANWVISCILLCEDPQSRANRKTFFIRVAQECKQIRNFSSMCAILGALEAHAISRLDLTHKYVPHKVQRQLAKLSTLLKQDSNYGAYRAAVQFDDQKGCIPWHEVHLCDVKKVLLEERDVENHHEAPLINFEKWTHLKQKAMGAVRYHDTPLRYNEGSLETTIAYLQRQLEFVTTDDRFTQLLKAKSSRVAENEIALRMPTAAGSVGLG